MSDISDRISITPAMLTRWRDEIVPASVAQMQADGFRPSSIPDEVVEQHPTKPGWLLVAVRFPEGRTVTMEVPPAHWAWADGRN